MEKMYTSCIKYKLFILLYVCGNLRIGIQNVYIPMLRRLYSVWLGWCTEFKPCMAYIVGTIVLYFKDSH